VAGHPCLLALDDMRLEFARIEARERARPSGPCRTCGERSRIALGGSPRCYRCRTGIATEGDHVRGSGSGPAVLNGDSNLNRISMEGERLLRSIIPADLCCECLQGFPLRVGIFVGRLDTQRETGL